MSEPSAALREHGVRYMLEEFRISYSYIIISLILLLYSAHVRMCSSMHYFALLHTLLNDAEPTAVAVKWDDMK